MTFRVFVRCLPIRCEGLQCQVLADAMQFQAVVCRGSQVRKIPAAGRLLVFNGSNVQGLRTNHHPAHRSSATILSAAKAVIVPAP